MKKILCILAIAVVSLGAFSCEADTSENDALFETQGTDTVDNPHDSRD